MRPLLRVALLGLTTLAGLAVAPTRGADAALERLKAPVAMAAAERWRLRPTQAALIAAPVAPARPTVDLPEARRTVRQVYPALIEGR